MDNHKHIHAIFARAMQHGITQGSGPQDQICQDQGGFHKRSDC